jgi:hypothetical protein
LNIGFSEELEFFSDKFDAFSMRAIDKHDIGFHFLFIVFVDFVEEIVDDGLFPGSGRSVEDNMRDFIGF